MRVKCIANNAKALFKRTTMIDFNPKSAWPIDVGESYEVYGMLLWNGNIHYLVVNRYKGVEQNPVFCPAELFEVTESKFPKDWYFSFKGYRTRE